MMAMGGAGGGIAASAPSSFRLKERASGSFLQGELERHPKRLPLASVVLPACYKGEKEELRLARTEGHLESLNIIDACAGEALEEAGKECIQEVSDFVAGWKFRGCGGSAEEFGASDLVPLAIVDAGLQLGDRKSAVDHIKKGLEGEGGVGRRGGSFRCGPRVVAVLRAQDCSSVQASLEQISRQCHEKGGKRSHRPLFMDALEEWYNSYYPASYSTSTSTSTSTPTSMENEADVSRAGAAAAARRSRGPVVVLLEDVEDFDKQVLRDLMNVLAQPPSEGKNFSHRRKRGSSSAPTPRHGSPVPMALVAIASARVGFPMGRLSPSAVRQLSPEYFVFPSSLECVEILYDKLFIQGRLPFWLGSRLLSWMKSTFNDKHLSVGTLSRQVKLEAFLHFNRPASYLCLHFCRPWLRRSAVGNCPTQTMKHMKYKLVRDSKMPPDQLGAALQGVSPRLEHEQAVDLIEQGLRREASRALKLWFFHKVWEVLLGSRNRETLLRDLRIENDVLGRPAAAGNCSAGAGSHAGPRDSTRAAELGSPMRIVGLLSTTSKRTKRYYSEFKLVSEALAYLVPSDVSHLLGELLGALPPTASQSRAPTDPRTNPSTALSGPTNQEQPGAAVSANESTSLLSEPTINQEQLGAAISANEDTPLSREPTTDCEQPGAVISANESPASSLGLTERECTSAAAAAATATSISTATTTATPTPTPTLTATSTTTSTSTSTSTATATATATPRATPISAAKATAKATAIPTPTLAATPTATATATATAPQSIQGLHGAEASYLRRGAGRVLKLWAQADEDGWLEPDDGAIQHWSRPSSRLDGGGGDVTKSGGILRAGVGSGKSAGSRGNRLFNSALHQTSATVSPHGNAEHGAPRSPHSGPDHRQASSGTRGGSVTDVDGKALRRACLVRELQVLFLHVMGEARDLPLGPGIGKPPPLTKHASVLAEVFCCDERDRETLETSLCPLARASVDLGMMEGACKGWSAVVQKRKEISKEQPVLDICALYSSYRGHGKTIDRSDWFADFRDETVKHRTATTPTELSAGLRTKSAKWEKKKKDKTCRPSKSSGRVSTDGGKVAAGGGGAGAGGDDGDAGGGVDPTGSVELLARFEHASDQLASMGYVRPLKRRKNLEREGRGRGAGPKGEVTRLVFSYTMEDGAL
ncbi:unnamed protein product [Pylaiella littoralis]